MTYRTARPSTVRKPLPDLATTFRITDFAKEIQSQAASRQVLQNGKDPLDRYIDE